MSCGVASPRRVFTSYFPSYFDEYRSVTSFGTSPPEVCFASWTVTMACSTSGQYAPSAGSPAAWSTSPDHAGVYAVMASSALRFSKYMLLRPNTTSPTGLFFSATMRFARSAPPRPTIWMSKPAFAASAVTQSPRPSPLEFV